MEMPSFPKKADMGGNNRTSSSSHGRKRRQVSTSRAPVAQPSAPEQCGTSKDTEQKERCLYRKRTSLGGTSLKSKDSKQQSGTHPKHRVRALKHRTLVGAGSVRRRTQGQQVGQLERKGTKLGCAPASRCKGGNGELSKEGKQRGREGWGRRKPASARQSMVVGVCEPST